MVLEINDLYTKDSSVLEFLPAEESVEIVTPDHEDGFGLLVRSDGSEINCTVKAGNSIYAMGDLAVEVPAGGDVLINLKNTGRFKNVNGEKSGKIIVEFSGNISDAQICAVSL